MLWPWVVKYMTNDLRSLNQWHKIINAMTLGHNPNKICLKLLKKDGLSDQLMIKKHKISWRKFGVVI